MMNKRILAVSLIVMAGALWAGTSPDADREDVKSAILDYVEGIYEVEPSRIERSVHPELWKRGFYLKEGKYHLTPMTFEQLVKLAGGWNKDGRAGSDAPKKIEIYEVLDQTASAKLTAHWGIDYFHLAKIEGRWMIMNVMWQSHPPE